MSPSQGAMPRMPGTATSTTLSRSLKIHSHPASLLWAHQLRREHATLLTRVEDLAHTLHDLQPDVEQGLTSTKMVEEAMSGMKGDSENTMKMLEGQTRMFEAVEKRVSLCEKMGNAVEELAGRVEGVGSTVEKVRNVVKDMSGDLARRKTVTLLGKRVDAVEENLSELSKRSTEREVVLVKDSMEGSGRLIKPKGRMLGPKLTHHISNGGSPLLYGQGSPINDEPLADNDETLDPDQMFAIDNRASSRVLHSYSSSLVADVELDQHLPMISYVSHSPHGFQNNLAADSLTMLPEPEIARLPFPASIKDIKQSVAQGWEAYMVECQKLLKTLPRRSEGDLVRALVSGILDDEKRKDCEAWLDERNWIWEHIKSFDEYLTMMETPSGHQSIAESQARVCTGRKHIKATQKPSEGVHRRAAREIPLALGKAPALEVVARDIPIVQRNQRIPQKQKESQHTHLFKTKPRSPGKPREDQSWEIQERGLPPSFQPQVRLANGCVSSLRSESSTEVEGAVREQGHLFRDAVCTPPNQTRPAIQDESDPHSLPRMLPKTVADKLVPIPKGAGSRPAQPQVQARFRKMRKRDYRSHNLGHEQYDSVNLQDMTDIVPVEDVRTGSKEADKTESLMTTTKKAKTGKELIPTEVGPRKTARLGLQQSLRKSLQSKTNTDLTYGDSSTGEVNEYGNQGQRMFFLPSLRDKETELIANSVEANEYRERACQDRVPKGLAHAAKKSLPELTKTNATRNKTDLKQTARRNEKKKGALRRVFRLPPEIPILPSSEEDL